MNQNQSELVQHNGTLQPVASSFRHPNESLPNYPISTPLLCWLSSLRAGPRNASPRMKFLPSAMRINSNFQCPQEIANDYAHTLTICS